MVKSDIVKARIYASRFVRRIILRQICSDKNHPILRVEDDLISAAAADMRSSGLVGKKIIDLVKSIAIGKVLQLSESEEQKVEFIEEIRNSDFTDLMEPN